MFEIRIDFVKLIYMIRINDLSRSTHQFGREVEIKIHYMHRTKDQMPASLDFYMLKEIMQSLKVRLTKSDYLKRYLD